MFEGFEVLKMRENTMVNKQTPLVFSYDLLGGLVLYYYYVQQVLRSA